MPDINWLFGGGLILLALVFLFLLVEHLDSRNPRRNSMLLTLQLLGLALICAFWLLNFGLHIGGTLPTINIGPGTPVPTPGR